MAECKSCGKTYYSISCPHCNGEVTDRVLGRTKRKSFLAFTITVLIIGSIGLISYLIAEFIENERVLDNAHQQSNQHLGSSNTQKKYTQQPRKEVITKPTNKPYTSQKKLAKTNKYPRYSNSIKLKSDSKITRGKDNRLKSNAPIYGLYKGIILSSPRCGEKYKRDLGLHKECYVNTLDFDKLYFSKALSNEFKSYKSHEAYVECNYNKKYGVM